MGLSGILTICKKGFFINEFGEILEVKNVYENNKISIEKNTNRRKNIFC